MTLKTLFLHIILLLSQIADAQVMFQQHYGGSADDGGSSVLQTDDGGYIVACRTMSYGNGSNDICILKTDAYGNEIWKKTYGGTGWDAPNRIKRTLDNCYIIAGETSSYGAGGSDAFLMKIDSSGDSLWFKTYGGIEDDGAWGVDVCEDNGFIICGVTCSFAIGFAAVYMIRTDSLGDSIWTKTYEKKNFNCAYDVTNTSDGGFLFTGLAETGGAPGADGFVIKTNSIGDTIWSKLYGGASYDDFSSFFEDDSGNYLLCGTTYNLASGSYDAYLVGITNNGDMIWEKTIGGDFTDNLFSITKSIDNNFFVAGSTESFGAGGKDVYVIKFNSDGDTIWTKTYGGAGDDWSQSIQETSDGGLIVSGYTGSYGNNYDIYLIKTDVNGYLSFETNFSVTETFRVYPNPSNGLFVIDIQDARIDICVIEIYSIQGKKIYQNILTDNSIDKIDIDIRNYPKGIYLICIEGKCYYKSSKIVIY